MNWPRPQYWRKWSLPLLAALLLGEVGLAVQGHRQSRTARAALDQRLQEASRLRRESPMPGEANARAIREDRAEAARALAAWREAWPGRIDALDPVAKHTQSLDEFFALLAWIDRTRSLAADGQVEIHANERFGFASLAHDNPPPELAPAISRQRQRLHYLLGLLFAAQPRALLAVRRELPLAITARAAPPQPPESGQIAAGFPSGPETDYFLPDPRLLIRKPGLVASEAFCLEFSGETPVLRAFLSRLSSGAAPVLVRSVGVEPLNPTVTREQAGKIPASGFQPLVVPALSRFIVVVEWIELSVSQEKPAA